MGKNRKCFAPNCRSGYSNQIKVSLFSVPKNQLDFQIWQKCIPRSDRPLQANDSVCEKHFNNDDIVRHWKSGNITIPLKVPRLKPGAIPTIFENIPSKRKNLKGKQRKVLTRQDKRELRNLIRESKKMHEEKRKKEEEKWKSYKLPSTQPESTTVSTKINVDNQARNETPSTSNNKDAIYLEILSKESMEIEKTDSIPNYKVIKRKIVVPVKDLFKRKFDFTSRFSNSTNIILNPYKRRINKIGRSKDFNIIETNSNSDEILLEEFKPEHFHNYALKKDDADKENINCSPKKDDEKSGNDYEIIESDEFDEEEWLKNYLQNRKRYTEQMNASQPKQIDNEPLRINYELNCRICIQSTTDLKSLTDLDENNIMYQDKIKTSFPDIELRDDEHYKMICDKCRQDLDVVYKFRILCQSSDKNLDEYKEKQKIQTEDKMKWKRRKSQEFNFKIKNEKYLDYADDNIQSEIPAELFDLKLVDTTEGFKVVKMYNCECCNKNFTLLNHLWIHKKVYHGTKNLECPKCEQKFSSLYRWKMHYNTHLPKLNKCSDCLRSFKTKEALLLHIKSHENIKKNFKCDVCSMSFASRIAWKHHKNLVHKTYTSSKFMCEKCGKVLYSNYSFNYHMLIHNNSKPFQCDKCDKSFRSKASLSIHMIQLHTEEKPFICDICGKQFKLKANLDSHRLSHTDHKPFECLLCSKKFRTKTALTIHQRVHSGERPYVCQECGKDFTSITMRRQHILRDHLKVKNFKCDECGKEFYLKKNLHIHKKIHKGIQYPCDVCGRVFKTKHYLKKHLRNKNVHKDIDKIYQCEYCQEKFTRKIHLKYHLRVHKEEKQFKCELCENSYISKSSLNFHTKHVHNEPLPCECCGGINFCMNAANVDIIDGNVEIVDQIIEKIETIDDVIENEFSDYESN